MTKLLQAKIGERWLKAGDLIVDMDPRTNGGVEARTGEIEYFSEQSVFGRWEDEDRPWGQPFGYSREFFAEALETNWFVVAEYY